MEPIRWEGQVAVFSSTQIDYVGWEYFDQFDQYMVIEGPQELMSSYEYYKHSEIKKIHRYDRLARFKKTLHNLLGWTSLGQTVNLASLTHILAPLKTWIKDDSVTSYTDAKNILIHYGEKKLIEFIPAILKLLNKPPALTLDTKHASQIVQDILDDFKLIERKYFIEGLRESRKYFPNMKYLALKLLVDHGAINVCIPLLKTRRKLVEIEQVYEKIKPARLRLSFTQNQESHETSG